MLGYTEDELKARTASDITHEDDHAGTEARIAEAYEGQRRNHRFEKRYRHKDTRVVWADVSTVLVPASGSNSAFFSVVIVDCTERKQVEEELHQKEVSLREAQIELAHISRVTTMGELTASIAHEVSQPLAAVVANANPGLRWLSGDSPNLVEARETIRLIARDGNRAGEIIGRIRGLAKKARPQKDWLDLNKTIGEVLAMVGSEVRRNRILVQTQIANDLPPILGDKIQLQQVILNLLMNAIEAVHGEGEGPGELWISSEKVAKSLGELEENELGRQHFGRSPIHTCIGYGARFGSGAGSTVYRSPVRRVLYD
jgi:PAS domain S-box-containing protein